jgi:hypothetical protein
MCIVASAYTNAKYIDLDTILLFIGKWINSGPCIMPINLNHIDVYYQF